jgi:hypothetical protein
MSRKLGEEIGTIPKLLALSANLSGDDFSATFLSIASRSSLSIWA